MVSLSNIKKNSNILSFITAGNPGGCFLCVKWVSKLEAHHLKYKPEITANLCHGCHHTAHFWPNRLTDEQKLKLLRLLYDERKAWQILDETKNDIRALAKHIAPSRNAFIRAQQVAEIKRIQPKKTPSSKNTGNPGKIKSPKKSNIKSVKKSKIKSPWENKK